MAVNLNTVSGIIYDAFDVPLANVTVQAFDKDLRSEQNLGSTTTDAKGFYSINFPLDSHADADVKTADIFLRVYSNISVTLKLLGESPVYFNAPNEFKLDYKIGNTPIKTLNEFDALVNLIKPLTEPQKVTLADLQENDQFKDISFLANETGEEAAKIALLPIAYTLSETTKIAPDILYGLFRLQFPTDFNALLLTKSESIADGIRTAIRDNLISARWEAEIDTVVQTLNRLAVTPILSGKDARSAAFTKILSAALPDSKLQQDFVGLYLSHEQAPEKFWEALPKLDGFRDTDVVAGIQSVLKLNVLTHQQPALTTLLFREQQNNPNLKEIRGFAAFNLDDWRQRIAKLVADGQLSNFPDGIEGSTDTEKTQHYAEAMTHLLKTLYPTDVFRHRLHQDTGDAFAKTKPDLITFFAKNPDYDLKNNNIHQVFEAADLSEVKDKTLLKNELMAINRLSKITDDYSQVSTLQLAGIDSATRMVNRYSAEQFAEEFTDAMSREKAKAVYKNAQKIDNRATALAMSYKMRSDIPIYAINGSLSKMPPDYVELFGDTKCDCAHCQSVYSPAAYFVDILKHVKNNSPAFTELTSRRPDLPVILLTCKNTNTALPYIDLVNELLENTIAPVDPVLIDGNPTYPHFQTTQTADELLAYPEHVNAAAYTALKNVTSAFNLPLNLPLEETRLYLDKLGVKRHELMELYFGKRGDSPYNDVSIAGEYLQLSPSELELFNGTTPKPIALGMVVDFLRETGLSYIEMLQLLECYFINPLLDNGERSIKIVSTTSNQATCNIGELTLQTAHPESLKVFPFIRLWKKTGWDIFDLDRVFTALGIVDFSADNHTKLIISLSHIARLNAQFNLPLIKCITLWADIDKAVYVDHKLEGQPQVATLYDSLFLNKKITSPLDEDFAKLGKRAPTLAEKAEIITAALNLSQNDFDLLNQPRFVDGKLTVKNLSVLHRYALMARMLKLSVAELIQAVDLMGISPFGEPSQTVQTLVFIDEINFIRSASFTISELSQLLVKSESIGQTVSVENSANVLTALREGLKKIELLDQVGATDEERAKNKRALQNNLVSESLATAFKTEAKIIDVLFNNLSISEAGKVNQAIDELLNHDFIVSEGELFTRDVSGAVNWVFPNLIFTYNLIGETWNRIVKLNQKLKLTSDEFVYLLSNSDKLQINGIWNLPVTATPLYPAFNRLLGLVQFRNTLTIAKPDWFRVFDLANNDNADNKGILIDKLATLCQTTKENIEFLTGKGANTDDPGFLKYTFPTDYLMGANLTRIVNCVNVSVKHGSRVDELAKLVVFDPANADQKVQDAANIAKGLLKSKYNETSWLDVIKPISNLLRIRKRDALISFLLTMPDPQWIQFRQKNKITDTNTLFAHFLIDVEMDACMLTSRIKQAISSVQLFVDRCLMNLETGIVLDEEFASQWDIWRKRYRVWEANRKIFLYPENWIEPDLRDDKSPFFKELESKLKQNEVTDETAEDALRAYLEKLDTVANLEMIGVFPDTLTGIVHAFGRTRNIPHQYFYTKQTHSIWSAWEKIDLDIEGDHILPVVWNNRLMLFWGIFTEKQVEDPEGFTVPSAGNKIQPKKYLDMKLAWSQYKKGFWTSKNLSDVSMHLNYDELRYYFLSSDINEAELLIRLFGRDTKSSNSSYLHQGAFLFNGCQNKPSLKEYKILSDYRGVVLPNDLQVNKMFIDEGNYDNFTLFEKGIFVTFSTKKFLAAQQRTVLQPNRAIRKISQISLLNNTPGKFRLLTERHQIGRLQPRTFFYTNEHHNFYVKPEYAIDNKVIDDLQNLTKDALVNRDPIHLLPNNSELLPSMPGQQLDNTSETNISEVNSSNFEKDQNDFYSALRNQRYRFQNFNHPYVCELIKTLNTSGIEGLYRNIVQGGDGSFVDGIQNTLPKNIFIGGGAYDPTPIVAAPYPLEEMEFNISGLYSIYNWELFFHIPLLIATRLSQNQKFDEARKWFHFIFDPTRANSPDSSGYEKFWLTNPFKKEINQHSLPIGEVFNTSSPEDLELQVDNWANNPFNPHAVARLRISAYMRSTVLKYIDNLIAWGDHLFQQNTIETINEASLLYVLAANILGKKPDRVPARVNPVDSSFSSIEGSLDAFSNAKVAIQSYFSLSDTQESETTINTLPMTLFCIPKNDQLLTYWDTVADRLFKIRHCQDITGVTQQLPLFEPPLDPALLVKAAAAGLDIRNVISDLNPAMPHYRFQVMLQKANELCNDVRALGNELLSALEKKDSEQLSVLRSNHELNMLAAVRDIKLDQVDEAKENLAGLFSSRNVIEAKRKYFGSRSFINIHEGLYLGSIPLSMIYQNMVIGAQATAAVISLDTPQVTIGPFSSGTTYGGENIVQALNSAAASFGQIANLLNTIGTMANVYGSFRRRQDDWTFQAQSAELELKQIDKQIAAAEIRLEIAKIDLQNHDLQIKQSKEVDEFLAGKFTNEELYSHMVDQIASVYFQSYRLAYELAKKAEKCLQFELGLQDKTYISFGYWDSLKKGLLSGEKLQYDLRRLDVAYLEHNRREFELTKHISLALLNPIELIKLKETGRCNISLTEELFDLDFPGHYFRRIKSVSLSLPCVVGPYTTISCTLRLVKNSIRINTSTAEVDPTSGNDNRFVSSHVPVNAIAVSNGQNDSGVFELSLRDERYLPFEGAGAVSEWSLELFNDNDPDFGKPLRQFDYNTISDVILHLNYTAREDAGEFKNKAIENLRNILSDVGAMPAFRIFNLRQDFPNQWHNFINPPNSSSENIFEFELSTNLFRMIDRDKNLKIVKISILSSVSDNKQQYSIDLITPKSTESYALEHNEKYGGLIYGEKEIVSENLSPNIPTAWKLKMTGPNPKLLTDELNDVFLVIEYAWSQQ